jgi:hypothetical protein
MNIRLAARGGWESPTGAEHALTSGPERGILG